MISLLIEVTIWEAIIIFIGLVIVFGFIGAKINTKNSDNDFTDFMD